jgi:hypothetical protein
MKSVLVYLIGMMLLMPCIFICSDSLRGACFSLVWGILMWHSPKLCPEMRKFWLSFWKVNLRIIYSF